MKHVFNCAQQRNIFIAAAYQGGKQKKKEEGERETYKLFRMIIKPCHSESIVNRDFYFIGWPTSVLILKP